MTAPVILIEPNSAHAQVTHDIEANLLQSLAELNPQATNTTILLTARDPGGDLIGGVSGATSYGWFLVKLLWVSDALRGTGIGTKLMHQAEKHAGKLGCHGAWLDTSNPQARAFYLKQGYSDFGILSNGQDNEPPGHNRWFMKKPL